MTTPEGLARLRRCVLDKMKQIPDTQEQLAAEAGMSTTTWGKVERGRPIHRGKYIGIDKALGWTAGSAYAIATGEKTRPVTLIESLDAFVYPSENVVPPSDAPANEDAVLLNLPSGLTPRQREQARIAGEAAARAVADALLGGDDEDDVQPGRTPRT
jgi:hypothetical protein